MVEANDEVASYDAIIIGAGLTGLHQLHDLLKIGLSVRLFEAGGGVGGTWYWNRYPGSRFDSESYSYSYGFSKDLLQEWEWSEHFAGQPETERYLNYVADRFDLRPHIQLNTRVTSAVYNEKSLSWRIETLDGGAAKAKFLIAAVGFMSAHYIPNIEGVESFQGTSFHTARWPREPVDFSKCRVGIIGTGPTGVQAIQEISKVARHLTIFQRTPVYACPLRNEPIDPLTKADIKANGLSIIEKARTTYAGFLHDNDPRESLAVTADERLEHYEKIWAERGFAKWHGNFRDTFTNARANELYAEFVRAKIRERVRDPVVAEMLVPKDYPFGAKRVPMETDYYEAFNRDNVLLVSIRDTPIKRITPKGIVTNAAEYELDCLIFATGFDAITGELTRIDIRGEDGQSLKAEWKDGMRNYLGLQTAGFPNFFIANAAVFSNVPRASEIVVEWITECILYMKAHGFKRIATTREAEALWQERSESAVAGSLFTADESAWFMGANIPGKKREFLLYGGGCAVYRKDCAEVAAKSYKGFVLS